ncbi:hypothetical protein EMCRGX_G016960 [Ephydatia muelleri]
MTSELTSLYDQRAHITLRPVSSHHSTTSELTPLYEHELTPLYDQRAHTTLRPVSSYHSMTSELTLLYDQQAHITLRPASSHSTNSKLTPLYHQLWWVRALDSQTLLQVKRRVLDGECN